MSSKSPLEVLPPFAVSGNQYVYLLAVVAVAYGIWKVDNIDVTPIHVDNVVDERVVCYPHRYPVYQRHSRNTRSHSNRRSSLQTRRRSCNYMRGMVATTQLVCVPDQTRKHSCCCGQLFRRLPQDARWQPVRRDRQAKALHFPRSHLLHPRLHHRIITMGRKLQE